MHRVREHEPAPEVHRELDRAPADRVRRRPTTDVRPGRRPRRPRDAPHVGRRRTDRGPDRAHRRRPLRPVAGDDPPPRLHGTASQASSSAANTGPSRHTRAGRRPPPGPRTPGTSRPRTRSTCSGDDLEERLAPRLGRPGRDRLAAAALAPERRDAHPLPRRQRERRERPEQRRRAGRERLVRPRLVAAGRGPGPSRGGPATRPPSRRRTPPRRAAGSTGRPAGVGRAVQQHDGPPVADRLVDEQPERADRAALSDSSRWRDRGSTSNGRPSGPMSRARRPPGGGGPAARRWRARRLGRQRPAGRSRSWRSARAADRQPAGLDGAQVDVLARADARDDAGACHAWSHRPGRSRGAPRAPRRRCASARWPARCACADRRTARSRPSRRASSSPPADSLDRPRRVGFGRRPRRPPRSTALESGAIPGNASASASARSPNTSVGS